MCALSDLALIAAGVLGAGATLARVPWLIPVICFAGAAFLLCYGVLAARRALRPGTLLPDATGARTGLAVTVGTCLALTWLNPHVYLDTVVLLGSMASTYGEHRWQFAAGAGLGSVSGSPVWATARACSGRCSPGLRAWRVLDGGIAVVMVALAVSLVVRGVTGSCGGGLSGRCARGSGRPAWRRRRACARSPAAAAPAPARSRCAVAVPAG